MPDDIIESEDGKSRSLARDIPNLLHPPSGPHPVPREGETATLGWRRVWSNKRAVWSVAGVAVALTMAGTCQRV